MACDANVKVKASVTIQVCNMRHLQVLVVIFGQELPEATASLASQVFGLCVALVGLATFALVLALLQQVINIPTLAGHVDAHCRKMTQEVRCGS